MTLLRTIQRTAVMAGAIIALSACGSKPEVVQRVSEANVSSAGVSADATAAKDAKSQIHEVLVNDVLHTSKYTYLDVTEDDKQFWVAVPRKEVEKGETYYYVGGLMKKNFKSKEYDRVFETVYLVSDVRKEPIFTGNASVTQALRKAGDENADNEEAHNHGQPMQLPEDAVSLEELFSNREKYAGKEITVHGKCVKFNKQIMGRNWVHIQDGTGGEKPYDLTITTSVDVTVGAVVSFTGKIALNVDFGAGYKYDVIMEEAHLN